MRTILSRLAQRTSIETFYCRGKLKIAYHVETEETRKWVKRKLIVKGGYKGIKVILNGGGSYEVLEFYSYC